MRQINNINNKDIYIIRLTIQICFFRQLLFFKKVIFTKKAALKWQCFICGFLNIKICRTRQSIEGMAILQSSKVSVQAIKSTCIQAPRKREEGDRDKETQTASFKEPSNFSFIWHLQIALFVVTLKSIYRNFGQLVYRSQL